MTCLKLFAGASLVLAVSFAMGADVPKEWKETYAKISKTIVDNNIKGYMTWMDKGFTNVQDGKKTGFAEYEKMFTDFMKPFKNVKAKAMPLTFTKKGADIIIDFRYTFSGDMAGKDGKTKTLKFFEEGTDTWRKSGGKWLEVTEQIKKEGMLPASAKV